MAVVIKIKVKIPQWLDKFFTCPLLTYRRLRYGYPFRLIRLTDVSGVVPMSSIGTKSEGKFTIVDPPDFYRLNSFNWLCSGRDENLYAARVIRLKSGRLGTVLMHREIFFTCLPQHVFGRGSPACPELAEGAQLSTFSRSVVDHTNTNSLDNRRANLRLATPSQNSCNSRRDKSNTYSRFRGVSFSKRKGKWFAAIRANGKKIWLGYFQTELDAARAYDEAARKYHGEFARLNFANA
jgi:hypothetical protein